MCSDSTGSIAVIFLDEEVSRIIDKTVFDLEAEAIQVNFFTELLCPKRLILLFYYITTPNHCCLQGKTWRQVSKGAEAVWKQGLQHNSQGNRQQS